MYHTAHLTVCQGPSYNQCIHYIFAYTLCSIWRLIFESLKILSNTSHFIIYKIQFCNLRNSITNYNTVNNPKITKRCRLQNIFVKLYLCTKLLFLSTGSIQFMHDLSPFHTSGTFCLYVLGVISSIFHFSEKKFL